MTSLFPWMAMIDVAGAAEAVEAAVDAALESEASPAAVGEAVTQQSIMGWGSGWSDSLDVAAWWTHLTQFPTTKGTEFSLHVVEALVIFVVGRWVAMAVTRCIGRFAAKANVDQTLIRFTRHLIYAAMLAFVVLSALNRLGIDTTSFTAVVGAAGLAIGFALQGSLSNFAAGVLLIVFKPFKVGDNVTAGGSSGTIEEIQIFNTIFKSGDNATIIVPNGAIMDSWKPREAGSSYTLPATLEPLADHRDDLLVLSGLAQYNGRAKGDGPGDHARSAASMRPSLAPKTATPCTLGRTFPIAREFNSNRSSASTLLRPAATTPPAEWPPTINETFGERARSAAMASSRRCPCSPIKKGKSRGLRTIAVAMPRLARALARGA